MTCRSFRSVLVFHFVQKWVICVIALLGNIFDDHGWLCGVDVAQACSPLGQTGVLYVRRDDEKSTPTFHSGVASERFRWKSLGLRFLFPGSLLVETLSAPIFCSANVMWHEAGVHAR
jgi:hypothetical protein